MILPPTWRQNRKLLVPCGNIGGQRRLHEGEEPVKWSIPSKGLLSYASRALGRHTLFMEQMVGYHGSPSVGRGREGRPRSQERWVNPHSLCVRYP